MTWKTLKGGDPAAKQTKRKILLRYGKICHAVTLYEICVALLEADLFDALDSNAVRRVGFSISSGSLWFPLLKGYCWRSPCAPFYIFIASGTGCLSRGPRELSRRSVLRTGHGGYRSSHTQDRAESAKAETNCQNNKTKTKTVCEVKAVFWGCIHPSFWY